MWTVDCPKCGHRWPTTQIGADELIVCPACNASFQGSHQENIPPAPPPGRSPENDNSVLVKLSDEFGGDPLLMLDGALGGAIAGVLVGITVGVIVGIRQFSRSVVGGVGGVVSGILTGFFMGFAAGIFIGVIVGLGRQKLRPALDLTPTRTTVLSGVVTGAVIAAFLGSYRWIPFGMIAGGAGALLWSVLKTWGAEHLPIPPDLRASPAPPQRPRAPGVPKKVHHLPPSP